MICDVKWNDNGWICRTQMNSFRFPAEMTHCWFGSCPGRSAKPTLQKIAVKVKPKVIHKPNTNLTVCAYINCNKPRVLNRKYCSDECRKKQARWNYRNKNK